MRKKCDADLSPPLYIPEGLYTVIPEVLIRSRVIVSGMETFGDESKTISRIETFGDDSQDGIYPPVKGEMKKDKRNGS